MDEFNATFPTISPLRRADTAQTTPILLRLVRGQVPLYYSSRIIYELGLWQAGGRFGVALHSVLNYWNSEIWQNNAVFETRSAAEECVNAILKDPSTACRINSPSRWNHYLDSNRYLSGTFSPTILSDYRRPKGVETGALAESVAAGAALAENVAAGEVVRQLWGRQEAGARTAVLKFAAEASLTYGNWTHWKWLYKQAETAHDADILAICMARLEDSYAQPANYENSFGWLPQKPGKPTVAYLLRRARRVLHALAESGPQQYVSIAAHILLAGRGKEALDPLHHWLSFDVLYSGSKRYEQSGHGRGGYTANQRRPTLRVADERAAGAWTERADILRSLASDPKMAWQTQEWAVKMLLRRNLGLDALPDALLLRYLHSPSPLLVRVASDYVAARLAEGPFVISPLTAAHVFFMGNGVLRRKLAERLHGLPPYAKWDSAFAVKLSELVGNALPGKAFSRRALDAAALLGSRYSTVIPAELLVPLVPALLATGRADLITLVQRVVERLALSDIPRLLTVCDRLNPAQKEMLVEMLVDSVKMSSRVMDYRTTSALVFAHAAWVREAGWRMLAGYYTSTTYDVRSIGIQVDLSALWGQLLSPVTIPAVFATALTCPDALRLLPAEPDILHALSDRLRADVALLDGIQPDAFALLLARLGLNYTVGIVAALPDATWANVRGRVLAELEADGKLFQFWQTVWTLPSDISLRHFIDDPDTARTFTAIATPNFLETSNPAFEPLLLAWLSENREAFGQAARPLLTAALHKMPSIRAWALSRLAEVGLTMPFALRLLESGLPESIAAGRAFFDAVPPSDPRELDFALTLCDSPDPTVQRYGRTYITGRRGSLPVGEMTRRLAEHPDPLIQEVVAQTLLEKPDTVADARPFDAQVLRTRDRGRKVKEMVKQRLHQTPASHMDTATLLEMARSTTPRDAEWALQELARLALAGEKIDGVQLAGVGGI